MLTLQNVLTPFVIKATLAAAGAFTVIGGVQQAALAIGHLGNVDHARQVSYVELAAQGR